MSKIISQIHYTGWDLRWTTLYSRITLTCLGHSGCQHSSMCGV